MSPHDSLGSNLIVQVKQDRVMRVLPFENEELNECWLSDRDRYSYEGLNSEERLQRPMLKEAGRWREVDWQTALEHVARNLSEIRFKHDPQQIGALASPHSTLEEMAILAKLMRAMGSDNVDFRLRQSDFSADGKRAGVPWLGMKLAEIGSLDRVLVVGSFLRKDHPLVASRLRQIAKRKSQINVLHCADDDPLMAVANKAIVRPSELAATLAQIVKAAAEIKQRPVPAELAASSVGSEAKAIAASLSSGQNVAVLLGNLAAQHPEAARLQLLAQELAGSLGGRFGFLSEAANSVGGYLAGCFPSEGGLNARTVLERPRRAYLLLNAEPDFDCHDPRTAVKAMGAADVVVALAAYRSFAADYANVLLPVVPFTETSGTFVNCEGRMQSFNGVVKPLGEARPAWKVLRVLGNLMSLPGFDYQSTEAIRDEVCRPEAVAGKLANRLDGITLKLDSPPAEGEELQRIADVPVYFGDPIVRRAASLQRTRDALPPRAWVGPTLAQKLGVKAGERVRVRQGDGEAVVEVGIDERLPAGCVRLAAGHRHTANLGPMFGPVSVERT
ncbi:MAG TPA: molybdopterin-dependent oxidoreductase [Burkholderiales bacterium]